MLISAAEDSSARVPALLERLAMTTEQVAQLRAIGAQHSLLRQPVLAQMAGVGSADGRSDTVGPDFQQLRDIDSSQGADVAAILSPSQLDLLRRLEQRAQAGLSIIATPAPPTDR